MRSRTLAITTVCLAAATMTACSSANQAAQWHTPEVPETLPIFTAASTLPFDSYQLGRAEREQLQILLGSLITECSKQYNLEIKIGGDYIKQETTPADEDPNYYQWGGRLGTMSEEHAAVSAYTAADGEPWQNGNGFYLSDPANYYYLSPSSPELDAQYSAVFYGPENAVLYDSAGGSQPLPDSLIPRDAAGKTPGEGGCVSAVETAIDSPLSEFLSDQLAETIDLTFQHEAVIEKNAEWSSCMKAAGFTFTRFDEPASETVGAPTPETIKLATADVSCTQASRWPDTFYYVLADYQEQAIAMQPESFQAAFTQEQQRLAALDRLTSD